MFQDQRPDGVKITLGLVPGIANLLVLVGAILAFVGAVQLQPPMVAPTTAPVAASTATTWVPKTPVTPGGDTGSDNVFAGRMRPRIDPMLTVSVGEV